jgi:hypothetical protein
MPATTKRGPRGRGLEGYDRARRGRQPLRFREDDRFPIRSRPDRFSKQFRFFKRAQFVRPPYFGAGTYPVDRVFGHLTQRRLIMAELGTKARKKLPAKDFAEPSKRAYPIEDKPHARNAKARASQAVKAGRMSKAEEAKIDKKADAVLKNS